MVVTRLQYIWRPENGVSRRGVVKTRGRNEIGRLAVTYRGVVSAALEWTFSTMYDGGVVTHE